MQLENDVQFGDTKIQNKQKEIEDLNSKIDDLKRKKKTLKDDLKSARDRIGELDIEVARLRELVEMKNKDTMLVSDLKEKLLESEKNLRSNAEMIKWMSKQLTNSKVGNFSVTQIHKSEKHATTNFTGSSYRHTVANLGGSPTRNSGNYDYSKTTVLPERPVTHYKPYSSIENADYALWKYKNTRPTDYKHTTNEVRNVNSRSPLRRPADTVYVSGSRHSNYTGYGYTSIDFARDSRAFGRDTEQKKEQLAQDR